MVENVRLSRMHWSMSAVACSISWLLVSSIVTPVISSSYYWLTKPTERQFYHQAGDIYFGAMVYPGVCTKASAKVNASGVQTALYQAVYYMKVIVDKLNAANVLGTGERVGFVVTDLCADSYMAGLATVPFISVANEALSAAQRAARDSFGVIGLADNRFMSRMVDTLESGLKMAFLPVSTSDALINNPYSARTVLPDRFTAEALIAFLKYFGWNFFVLLYSVGESSENVAQRIREKATDAKMCIAYELRLLDVADRERQLKALFAQLLNKTQLIVNVAEGDYLITTLEFMANRAELRKYFTVMASNAQDVLKNVSAKQLQVLDGAFTILPKYGASELLMTRVRQTAVSNLSADPWTQALIEARTAKCQAAGTTCVVSTLDDILDDVPDFLYATSLNLTIFSALQGFAAYRLQYCANVSLAQCAQQLNAGNYIRSMGNIVVANGNETLLHFDKNLDIDVGTLDMRQCRVTGNGSKRYNLTTVASYNVMNDSLEVYNGVISWASVSVVSANGWPESKCSDDCAAGYRYVRSEIHCCWSCAACLENQFVLGERSESTCESCPSLTWPTANRTSCAPVRPEKFDIRSGWGVFVVVAATIGLVLTVVCFGVFVANSNHALIKASNRALSFALMLLLAVGFSVPLIDVANDWSHFLCAVSFLTFNINCAAQQAIVLTKNLLVAIIFRRKLNCLGRWRLRIHLFLLPAAIGTQVIIAFVACSVDGFPQLVLLMADPLTPLVESHCKVTVTVFFIPLFYMLSLTTAMSTLGFLNRKIHENFNEAWHIFVMGWLLLLGWIAFIPAYWMTTRAFYKTLLYCAAQLFTNYALLVAILVPKVYAVLAKLSARELRAKLAILSQPRVADTNHNQPMPSKQPPSDANSRHLARKSFSSNRNADAILEH